MTKNIKTPPQDLHESIIICLRANLPVMVVGAPGCGKSEISRQAALAWEPTAGIRMIPAVSLLPTDSKGLGMPTIDRTHAEWLLYDWALDAVETTTPLVIQFEDVGQAPIASQASLMPILQDRQVGGRRISDSVRFILTSNRREDKAGVTAGVIEPLKNRCAIFELETGFAQWRDNYALPNSLPIPIIAFYGAFPKHLQNFLASADLTNSPTARQAAAVAKIYAQNPPRQLWPALYNAVVGQPAMLDLVAYLDLYGKIPNPDEILMNPETAPLPDRNQASMVYATVSMLIPRATPISFGAIMRYIERLQDREYTAFFVACSCADRKEGDQVVRNPIKDTSAYCEWAVKNSWMFQ